MSTTSTTPAIQQARTCYDHMAGKLGVAVTKALLRQNMLELNGKFVTLTDVGEQWFAQMGVNVAEIRSKQRAFAYACIDGTERKPHLAGALGAALCDLFISRQWIIKSPSCRVVEVTAAGVLELKRQFGIEYRS